MMKSIKWLLDRLRQLIGRLQVEVTKLEVKNEGLRQDELYKLRLDRYLKELGITKGDKLWEAGYKFDLAKQSATSNNSAFRKIAAKIAQQNGKTISERNKALAIAMSVKLPTLAEKAKGTVKKVSDKTRVIREKIVEKTNEKSPVIKQAFFALLRLLAVLLVIALLLWALIFAFFSLRDKKQVDNKPTQTETLQSETPQPEVRCKAPSWEFIEHKEDGSNPATQRWFIDGVQATQKGQTPQEGLKEWIEKSKRFRMTYAIMRELAFNKDLAKNQAVYFNDILSSKLDYSNIPENGTCATSENIEEMSRIEAAYASFEVFGPDDPKTPKDWDKKWFNSYFADGKFVQPTIGGTNDPLAPDDKSVFFVRRPDGFMFAVRGVCGNVQTEHRHDKVGKKHDHDDSDKDKPKPPPPPKLTPKSSNPKDYKKPGDGKEKDSGTGTKPKATVNTPAEKTPPTVETSKTGGGGVIDTPTNKPGSETGVTAPSAKPAPKVETPKPPNEGGTPVNDGVVTDD